MNHTFENLEAWQHSQELSVAVYSATKSFPKEEMFGITNQLRRASSSISANIAEGYGRTTNKDKLHFMTIAYGSLLETKNFIYLSQKLGYLEENATAKLISSCTTCQKLLNGFKRSLKS